MPQSVPNGDEPVSIFISIGSRYRPDQKAFFEALKSALIEFGVKPRIINDTDYPTSQPLRFISEVLRQCQGAIVVAFERSYFPSGEEKPKSEKSLPLSETRVTTPWNQIEAAMAYQQGIPLLVLAEEGLRLEGLIEGSHDWYLEHVRMSETALTDKTLRARLQAWCKRATAEHESRPLVPPADADLSEKMTFGRLFKIMPIPMFWQIAAMLATAAATVFGVGVSFGIKYPAIAALLK